MMTSSAVVFHQLLQLFFGHDLSVEQMDLAFGVFHESRIMRDHADRRPFAMQILQQGHDGFAVVGIQVSRGLVGEQDRGMTCKRAGHCDTLLLTSGELRRIMTKAVCHADALEGFHHSLLALR
jgi:hypothetical protein